MPSGQGDPILQTTVGLSNTRGSDQELSERCCDHLAIFAVVFQIVSGDLTDAVTRLKQERSGGYLFAQGSARFARSLVETGLIDEYRLVIHPIVLGAGERLSTAPLTIEPLSTTAFSGGAVAHVFAAHP